MLTVDSYVDIANQVDYVDIKPAIISSYDFRPKVEDIAGTSRTLEVIDEITGKRRTNTFIIKLYKHLY